MPQYRIRPGHSFRMADGAVKTADDVIELDLEVATQHANSVSLVEPQPEIIEAEAAIQPTTLEGA